MLTIHEIADEFRISLRKLRAMQKRGCLRCEDSGDPLADEIAAHLKTGRGLSVRHLIALSKKPGLLGELGQRQDAARTQLEALGHLEPAPASLWPEMAPAASHDAEAVAKLVAWARGAIGNRRVNHHYLAVRLILAVPEALRKYEYPRLNRIFLNMRKHPSFAGWFTIEQRGKRRVTWYHRPEGFDL